MKNRKSSHFRDDSSHILCFSLSHGLGIEHDRPVQRESHAFSELGLLEVSLCRDRLARYWTRRMDRQYPQGHTCFGRWPLGPAEFLRSRSKPILRTNEIEHVDQSGGSFAASKGVKSWCMFKGSLHDIKTCTTSLVLLARGLIVHEPAVHWREMHSTHSARL